MRGLRAALVLGLGLLVGCNENVPVAGGVVDPQRPLPKGAFVARYEHGSRDTRRGHGTYLSVFDQGSGKHLRDLVHLRDGSPARLGGFSRARDGSVVYALSRGPEHTGEAGTGTPRPGSCGGTVYRLDAGTGRVRSLFVVGNDRMLGAPRVSPDGRSVAYLSQPCPDAAAQEVVVHDLATDRERMIRVEHAVPTGIGWRADGMALVLSVSFADPTRAAGFLVAAANVEGTQPESAVRAAPDRGCVVEAATSGELGVQLVEGCPDLATVPARLLQLVGAGPTVAWRADIQLCPRGMTLAHDLSGGLLVSSTTSCGGAGDPVDVVQLWIGRTARELGRYSNPDQVVNEAG